ncbi:1-acyl-sn-glycerol-3-phosphate acyltransferase alpha-like [Patiria miniata]|uniref:1-acylglycerol-3-phosphate O-acyltransferase n=1 Tax=Patiria miniata TaxID=46514 RepID=A0A914AL08_PATMI|nr:1-acyl-sn-glycerol-3-phosphate acyltransferase alpha-like [Patiria miniata]
MYGLMVLALVLVVCYALCKASYFLQFWIKFFMFGIWNNFLGLLVAVAGLLSFRPGDSINFWWWNFFSFCIQSNWLFGFDIRILRSLDRLDRNKPYLIVTNHQTSMDQFVYLSAWAPGRYTVLSKKSLKYALFYGLAMIVCGAIFIDRSSAEKARQSTERCVRYLKQTKLNNDFAIPYPQGKLWVYPEGTRSHTSEIDMLPFKRGAFHIAVQAQVPIVPVVASPYKHMFDTSRRRFDKVEIVLDTLPDVPTEGLTADDVPELTEKVRDMMLQRFREISKLTDTIRDSQPLSNTSGVSESVHHGTS